MIEQIKELKWDEDNGIHTTIIMGIDYRIAFDESEDKWRVSWYDYNTKSSNNDRLESTLGRAKRWVVETSLPSKTKKWLNPDPLTEYAAKFTQWSTDRKIIQNGNLQTQGLKLVSEIGELADNIAKGRDTKDDIGDCFVVLNNLVEMQGYTWQECLAQAWNDIKDRKGHMNENGVFIKEGDTDD